MGLCYASWPYILCFAASAGSAAGEKESLPIAEEAMNQEGAAERVSESGLQEARSGSSNPKVEKNTREVELRSNGLHLSRKFTRSGEDPSSAVQWVRRDAVIWNEKGRKIFEQKNVEVPESWSQMATNVVASKYFRGALGSPERETSVKQLIDRVVDTISLWAVKDRYFSTPEVEQSFRDELKFVLVSQYAAFNSPVWFNVGVEAHPQCSACFILSVEDTMESLLDLQKAEAKIFKYGSGAGSNLSKIRSSREALSGGGVASGPVSFMRGFDAWAGTIKSGGKTRRAAKMQILDVDHPDILDFVRAKKVEEQKAWALIEEGYNGGFNVPGGAYDSVFFQNSNLSVRASDEFMTAAAEGRPFSTKKRTDGSTCETHDAASILREISEGTWICGDPGLQFDTTINDWHTTPKSGRINASNPCSEYMHLDDSACNLASINSVKFLNADGSLDVELLGHVVDLLITAQDILVENASYPTPKIGRNAVAFRQLGLGFANLGALLMSLGVAYDSDEGRSIAGSLMAIICGRAYGQSAKLASELGPFEHFPENREEMLRVIEKHNAALSALPLNFCTEPLVSAARASWDEALRLGRDFGYRNSQVTVLAPTGTIAFLMDCDTTGIEPDIALVKYKKLVGGGMLKMVNQSIPRALERLGYSVQERKQISAHVEEHDTIEGAPGLKTEHLPIFDCAFKPLNGSRTIHYKGHLRMMAACQPFVSGAISKTVNLPENATVEEIYQTYLEAWRIGLKAIAIYRDNSKRSQPLATSKGETKKTAGSEREPVRRKKLPDERQSITHKFQVGGHEGYITVGLFEDGTPGEIFLTMAKEGSTISGIMDAFATSVSFALQYGVPLSFLVQKFSHMRFEPSGFTPNKQIPYAKSILDYLFRWLSAKFLSADDQKAVGVLLEEVPGAVPPAPIASTRALGFDIQGLAPNAPDEIRGGITFSLSDDAPPCSTCGSSLMVRQGSCYRCLNCGAQGGCG